MRFMVLMIPGIYRGNKKMENYVPKVEDMEEMGKFNDSFEKAGLKIIDALGLHPLTKGARITFEGGKGKGTVTDGPFVEAKEVLGGFWMLEAKSKDAVVNWMKKCPADKGDIIEIRQIFEEADFQQQGV